jgi:hypothetical protein
MKYLEILNYISHGYFWNLVSILIPDSFTEHWFLYGTLFPLWNSGSFIEL